MKFIVTNIENSILLEAYDNFREKFKDELYSFQENYSDVVFALDIKTNINASTFDYCFKKLTLLLYGQQQYIVKRRLELKYFPERLIELKTFLNCSWLSYLIDKIEAASDKYGLLFLKDEDFMQELKNYLYYEVNRLDIIEKPYSAVINSDGSISFSMASVKELGWKEGDKLLVNINEKELSIIRS